MIPNKERRVLRGLGGVREVGLDMDKRVNEVHGMWDREAGSLRRLDGKLQSSTSPGAVRTIQPLRFRDRNITVVRNSSSLQAVDDPLTRGGLVRPSTGNGYNLPADWPDEAPITPGNWLPSSDAGSVGPQSDRFL